MIMSPTAALAPPAAEKARIAAGIHAGISFVDYLALDAVNNTTLKLFRRTPAHARYAMTHPEEDTAALRTGEACHAAILEPALFAERYVRAPRFDKRTNKGKSDAAAWAADHAFQSPLLPDEWDMAAAMRDAVWAHPLARELLTGKGQNEMTAIWLDEPTGLLCKARVDRFTSYDGWSAVVDIKTARDAGERGFAKACAEFFYHQQTAYYLDGLNALAPHKRRFLHLVIEKEAPHCVIIYELDDPAIEEGRRQYRRALTTLAECREKNDWPGYPVGIYGLDIPHWSYELGAPPK